MHDRTSLIENRVRRVLLERILPATHRPVGEVNLQRWDIDGGHGEPLPVDAALDQAVWTPAAVGDRWGPVWGTTWFRLSGQVPADLGDVELEILLDLGWAPHSPGFQSEGYVLRSDRTVVKGLNPRNNWIPLVDNGAGAGYEFFVEAAANPLLLDVHPFLPTELGEKPADGEPIYAISRAQLCVRNREVVELASDLDVLTQLAAELPSDSARKHRILLSIERCLDVLGVTDVEGRAAQARRELAGVLASPAHASAHHLTAIGHAHIDTAWLWPTRETRRKVRRTLANVCNLIDTEPEFRFAMSQAQQLAWLEEDAPELFARVRAAVAAGRIIPVGGMWVESDTNMVGGEAFCRQFLHGQRFFRERFGVTCTEAWLPDTFGYTASLPQLVALSGITGFLTQKISWNQTNPFPHHTFAWEGLDGTRVLTHFPPADTYNSELSGRELAHSARNFRDKAIADHALVPFGWGDGGGGPTREMIARARRTADLEGSPKVSIRSPKEFFDDARAEYLELPVWRGELYLELHRGTLTTQRATKRGNRRTEHLLREAELWATTATIRCGTAYPYDELDELWKRALLDQFHDTLPGTSIAWVHREVAEGHEQARLALEEIISEATTALAPGAVFNPAPIAQHGVPALGAATVVRSESVPTHTTAGDLTVLDNGIVRVTLDADGCVISAIDLATGRESIPPRQRANTLQAHLDFPNMWDAWDIDEFYRNNVTDVSAGTVTAMEEQPDGSVGVLVDRQFGQSTVRQQVTLAPGARRVDFVTEIDWQESEQLLKVAFPVDVHCDSAAFETQFGHLMRPTHTNTSWDAARFEVCAHRWAQVEEPGFGMAVVNDSTYGHEVTRHERIGGGTFSTIRLSLVRSPRFPDPRTDIGRHEMHFALVIGADRATARDNGYAVNLPVRATGQAACDARVAPLVGVSSGSAVIEAVKMSEDRSGDVIVRLYEADGRRGTCELATGFDFSCARLVNILEDDLDDAGTLIRVERAGVRLSLRPFQIATVRFTRSS